MKTMKKSTVRIIVIFLIIIICIIGYYTYLSGRRRDTAGEAKMTTVQLVLSRDLENDYPPTVKEVIKYYADIQKCFYNEECTDEEVEQLGRKARELYDDELLSINEESANLLQLKADIASFKSDKKQIGSVAVASSVNVDTFQEDGYDFARIQCTYSLIEDGQSSMSSTIYLLRRDENRRWKIYGWDLAKNVNPTD